MPPRPPTFLITAGPTVEDIDPVRFISNRATGKLGFLTAQAALAGGHRVILIHGPVPEEVERSLPARTAGLMKVAVRSADEMHRRVQRYLQDAQVVVMSAAVADFTVEAPSNAKLKKREAGLNLRLKPTHDILAELGEQKRTQRKDLVLIGFALETGRGSTEQARAAERLREAYRKLTTKNLDALVLDTPAAMGADAAEFRILRAARDEGNQQRLTKRLLARRLIKLGRELWLERQHPASH
ncbi:MAG: hypothetical protein AMXMBFR7_48330 [Planctomycetota bacterium]